MYIFTCENTFEDMMCCIYHAWEKALKVGHGCVRLEKRGEEQISLFDEYIYVEYNEEEYKKVVRSIKHKISEEAYACVYYACLSSEQDALDTAYRFLIKGFKIGSDITFMRNDPDVMRIKDIRRKVLHETRYFMEGYDTKGKEAFSGEILAETNADAFSCVSLIHCSLLFTISCRIDLKSTFSWFSS